MVVMSIKKTFFAVGAASALVLAGCAGGNDASSDPTNANADALQVKASFYPLQYLVERIGTSHVEVESLTPPGTDAHALELSPKTVSELSASDAVVYLHGFQSAVDEAVEQADPEHVLDVTASANIMDLGEDGEDHDHDHEGHHDEEADHDHEAEHEDADHDHEAEHEDADHDHEAEHEDGDHDEHGHHHDMAGDPHFWLDPARMADTAIEIANFLSEIDPSHLDEYKQNAANVAQQLNALDAEITDSFAQCSLDTFVVSHKAFGYLANKIGLHQLGISGLEPEVTPSPERLKEIGEIVNETGVKVIYAETNVSPKTVEVLADDLGVETMTLDPGATQNDPNADYMDIMRQNVESLRKGLDCK